MPPSGPVPPGSAPGAQPAQAPPPAAPGPARPQAQPPHGSVAQPDGDDVFFEGVAKHSINLWGYVKWILVCALGGTAAVLLVRYEIVQHWALFFLFFVGTPGIAYEYFRHVTTRYKVSRRRIETEHGIITKTVDSLELWRVLDVRYNQSLFDRILNNGRITLIGTDQTDKELVLHGLPDHRALFEKLRDAVQLARHSSRPMELVPGQDGEVAEFMS